MFRGTKAMYSPKPSTGKVVRTAHSNTVSSSSVSLMVGFGTLGMVPEFPPALEQSAVQEAQSLGLHAPISAV